MDEQFGKFGACRIDNGARIRHGAVIGKPFRPLLGNREDDSGEPTVIGPDAYVGFYTSIGAGSVLSRGVIVDDYCSIESDVEIGERSLVIYRAQICNEAVIGKECVIGGFVAERTRVGDRVRVFGHVIHSQRDPTLGWDAPDAMEESATIESGAFVGFNSTIVGKVVIGLRAYVCAGAVVTKDVPAGCVAYGVNKITPFSKWPGGLAQSPHFSGDEGP